MHLNDSPSHVTLSIHLIAVTLINLIILGVQVFCFHQLHYCYMFRGFTTFIFHPRLGLLKYLFGITSHNQFQLSTTLLSIYIQFPIQFRDH